MVYPHIQYLGPAHPAPLPPTDPASVSQAQTHVSPSARELDSRVGDGIHVRLLWDSGDGHVSVAVHDTKTGDAFELPVDEGTDALDVYHHPYAYAASSAARGEGAVRAAGAVRGAAHSALSA